MAQAHVVYLTIQTVSTKDGSIINKNSSATSIKSVLTSSSQVRVLPTDDVPNSSGYPTIKEYILAEASDNYIVHHIDNTMIITYHT